MKTNNKAESRKSRGNKTTRAMKLEALEPRLLLSGDGLQPSYQMAAAPSAPVTPVEYKVEPGTDSSHAISIDLSKAPVPVTAARPVKTYSTSFPAGTTTPDDPNLFRLPDGSMVLKAEDFSISGKFIFVPKPGVATASPELKFGVVVVEGTSSKAYEITAIVKVSNLDQNALYKSQLLLDATIDPGTGEASDSDLLVSPVGAVKKGNVVKIQHWLKSLGYTDAAGNELAVNGKADDSGLRNAILKLKSVLNSMQIQSFRSLNTSNKFDGSMLNWYLNQKTPNWTSRFTELQSITPPSAPKATDFIPMDSTEVNVYGSNDLFEVLNKDTFKMTGVSWMLGEIGPSQAEDPTAPLPNTTVDDTKPDSPVYWPGIKSEVSLNMNEWVVYQGTAVKWEKTVKAEKNKVQFKDEVNKSIEGFDLQILSGTRIGTYRITKYDTHSHVAEFSTPWAEGVAPEADATFKIVDPDRSIAKEFELGSDLLRAYWAGQAVHESQGFTDTSEDVNSLTNALDKAATKESPRITTFVYGSNNWKYGRTSGNTFIQHLNTVVEGLAVKDATLTTSQILLSGANISTTNDYYKDCQIVITGTGVGRRGRYPLMEHILKSLITVRTKRQGKIIRNRLVTRRKNSDWVPGHPISMTAIRVTIS
jgi:hypothetical protein